MITLQPSMCPQLICKHEKLCHFCEGEKALLPSLWSNVKWILCPVGNRCVSASWYASLPSFPWEAPYLGKNKKNKKQKGFCSAHLGKPFYAYWWWGIVTERESFHKLFWKLFLSPVTLNGSLHSEAMALWCCSAPSSPVHCSFPILSGKWEYVFPSQPITNSCSCKYQREKIILNALTTFLEYVFKWMSEWICCY